LDLFLILVLIAAGIAGWVAFKKGSLSGMWRALPMPGALAPAPEPAGQPAEPDIDVSDRSAWIQSRVRELLAKEGVKEKHMLRAYNAERQEGGIQWLEDTLEIRRPAKFDEKGFLEALAPVLAKKRLVVMDDKREGGKWTLSLGDRKRIYQRVIFER
jgi:hypothetical protein